MAIISNGFKKRGYFLETLQYHPDNFFKTNSLIKNNVITHDNLFLRTLKLIFFIKKYKPDIIISFLDGPNIISCFYKLIFFWRQTKLIVGERNHLKGNLKIYDIVIRFPYILSNYIVCNSKEQRKTISSIFGRKTLFIPNGKVDPLIKKKRINIVNAKNINLIVPARFIDQKNPLNLLMALKQTSNIIIHWYGQVFKDYDIFNECIEYVSTNKLNKKFKLFEPVRDIYEVMINYDAVLLPSFYEGCPNAIIDGMFCGLPILASNIPNNSIYLNNQKELLFNPYDSNEIAAKLNYFSKLNITARYAIGNENYKNAKSFFDYQIMLDRYEKLF